MPDFVIATRAAMVIVRGGAVELHLEDLSPTSIAIDEQNPKRLYAGTWGNGLWRSRDVGRSWEPAGAGIPHDDVSAVAVDRAGGAHTGVVYAGTEPSTISRSEAGGDTWAELAALLELPSSDRWSFPPKPDTHHVQWIETDPHSEGLIYAAIEAGALVSSPDGGATWRDRVGGGPIDTHTAATHPEAAGRVYSAAGDGYFESLDGGQTWSRPMEGLQHRYMVGVAVDPGDPERVVVSGASGPYSAYRPRNSEGYVYRNVAGGAFEPAMDGLPAADGTVASRLATSSNEPGVFYAANNHGLFRSADGGATWSMLEIAWPQGVFRYGVDELLILPA